MDAFDGHYDDWRQTRYDKIISLFGADYFSGKTMLELGCGLGKLGMMFDKLGTKVTFTDGRPEHLDNFSKLYGKHHKYETIVMDQDGKWDLERKFDIVLHTGVLYHLKNWQQDLAQAVKHTKSVMILETEVANSSDDSYEFKQEEMPYYDQALNGIGIRPSAAFIEKYLTSLGVAFTRYDDSDLNTTYHKYDWPVFSGHVGEFAGGKNRRFWIVRV